MSKGMTDMTQGSPMRLILGFSLPLIAGNLLQQCYNMVDSIVVGQFVGSGALAAVGTCWPVIFLLNGFFLGIGIGATILISQFYGARQMEKVKATVDTLYTAIMAVAVPFSLLGILISRPILRLIQVPEDALDMATLYMWISFGGVIGVLGYNANSGILQGLGDSRTPLLFLVISSVMNIVLDLLFVVVFHWDVPGVAAATVLSQLTSWLFGVFYINRKYPDLAIHPLNRRFDKALGKQILRLGLPTGVQNALFSVGMITLQGLVNSGGSSFMAGYNGANKIDTLAFLPIQSFTSAVTTYVGQNIGAGKFDRVRRGVRATMGLCVGVSAVLGVVLSLGGPFCMRLFTSEPEVVEAGMAYLVRVMPFYWLMGIMFILSGVMRGAGEMRLPLIASLVSLWLARLPAAYLLAWKFGLPSMHWCFAIGWVIGVAMLVPAYLGGGWRDKAAAMRVAGEE